MSALKGSRVSCIQSVQHVKQIIEVKRKDLNLLVKAPGLQMRKASASVRKGFATGHVDV